MDYFYLLLGFLILIGGGELLVKGAGAIALRFNMSPLVIGLTIVSFGTSAPELLVSVMAILDGHSDVAIGNVVGSNISNIALVLGVTVLVRTIHVRPQSILIDWPVMFLVSALLYLFCLSGLKIVLWEGLVFISALAVFNIGMIQYSRNNPDEATQPQEEIVISRSIFIDVFYLFGGCVLLALGAHLLVEGVVNLAKVWGISERVISLSVVAFGTSLPELTTSVMAALKKQTELALGNVLGSNIYNVLCILGVSSILTPIEINPSIINWDIWWMLGVALMIYPFMRLFRRLGKLSGVLLISMYIFYIYLIFSG